MEKLDYGDSVYLTKVDTDPSLKFGFIKSSKNMIEKAKVLNEKRKFFKENRIFFIENEIYKNIIKLPACDTVKDNLNSNSKEKNFIITHLDIPVYSNLFKNVENIGRIRGGLSNNLSISNVSNKNYHPYKKEELYLNNLNTQDSIYNNLTSSRSNERVNTIISNANSYLTQNTSLNTSHRAKFITPYQKHEYYKENKFKEIKNKLSKQVLLDERIKFKTRNREKKNKTNKIEQSEIEIFQNKNKVTPAPNISTLLSLPTLPDILSPKYNRNKNQINNLKTYEINLDTSPSSRQKYLEKRLRKQKIAEVLSLSK